MKHPRILGDGQCYYHVLSRVIERRFIFGEQEQEYFKKIMRAQEAFSGVRVMTWTCMSNHFHMLVAVDDRESEAVKQELALLMDDDEAFLTRLKHIYAPAAAGDVRTRLALLRADDDDGLKDDSNSSSSPNARFISTGQEQHDENGGAGAFVVLEKDEVAERQARQIAEKNKKKRARALYVDKCLWICD